MLVPQGTESLRGISHRHRVWVFTEGGCHDPRSSDARPLDDTARLLHISAACGHARFRHHSRGLRKLHARTRLGLAAPPPHPWRPLRRWLPPYLRRRSAPPAPFSRRPAASKCGTKIGKEITDAAIRERSSSRAKPPARELGCGGARSAPPPTMRALKYPNPARRRRAPG